MAIPDYKSLILPLLRLSADGAVHSFSDTAARLAEEPDLTRGECAGLLFDGAQTAFRDCLERAKVDMKDSGLLVFPEHDLFQITEQGRDILRTIARQADDSVLGQYADYEDIKNLRHREGTASTGASAEALQEQMAIAFRRYQSQLENDLLAIVKQASPSHFQQLVTDLLVVTGYVDSQSEIVWGATKRPADEGVGGVVKQGSEVICIQAGCMEGSVGEAEIQRFVNTLHSEKATRGVYITTSVFAKEVVGRTESISPVITLIDGDKLAGLMISFDLGVSASGQYQVKQVSPAYFGQ